MSYREEQKVLWKGIWGLRYEILLFILLSIAAISVIHKILFFIPKSWGSYGYGEFTSLRNTFSFVLGFIFAGFSVYKFHSMKEEKIFLKKTVLLFYALHPESKYEIYGIMEYRKANSLPKMLGALLDLEDMATEHNLLLYLSQLQQQLDANTVIRELRANPALLQGFKEIIRIRK